jgi:hypothetical protein
MTTTTTMMQDQHDLGTSWRTTTTENPLPWRLPSKISSTTSHPLLLLLVHLLS